MASARRVTARRGMSGEESKNAQPFRGPYSLISALTHFSFLRGHKFDHVFIIFRTGEISETIAT